MRGRQEKLTETRIMIALGFFLVWDARSGIYVQETMNKKRGQK